MRNRWRWAAVAVLVAASPPLLAGEEYDKLLSEFQAAQQQYQAEVQKSWEEYQAAVASGKMGQGIVVPGNGPPPAGVELADEEPADPIHEYLPRFRAYAEKHAGTPEAIPALAWIVQTVEPGGPEDQAVPADVAWAIGELKKQAGMPQIKQALTEMRLAISNWGATPLAPLLEAIRDQNQDPEVKAEAMFWLGCAYWDSGWRDARGPNPDYKAEIEAGHQKGERLFRAVVKEYPDTAAAHKAEPFLFELEHLQVGMQAPDLAGTDENGKPVKLCDFRGRVVVVNFWGHW